MFFRFYSFFEENITRQKYSAASTMSPMLNAVWNPNTISRMTSDRIRW